MKTLKYFKKRKKLNEEVVSTCDFFHWNDPLYVKSMKEFRPERYNKVLESLKKHDPGCCIKCCAFYWLENNGEITGPACTMGADFQGIDEYKEVCENCPIKTKEIEG